MVESERLAAEQLSNRFHDEEVSASTWFIPNYYSQPKQPKRDIYDFTKYTINTGRSGIEPKDVITTLLGQR